MYATILDRTTDAKTKILTSPLTNYNIIVLDQALKGRSFITFTNASTIRDGNGTDANVSSFDISLYDKSNTYNLKTYGRYSKIFSANPYDGFNTGLKLGKVSGKVQYFLQNDIKSARYNPNDLGYLQTPNLTAYRANASYHQYTSTKNFLSYAYTLDASWQRIYKPNAPGQLVVSLNGFWYFNNFWDVSLTLGDAPVQHDYFVLGRAFQNVYVNRPAFVYAELEGSTDSRKKLFFSYYWQQAFFYNVSYDKSYHKGDFSLRYRFSNKVSMTIEHADEGEINYIVNTYDWIHGKYLTEANGDPIIGFVNFKDITTTLSGIYNFTPKLNFNFRLRHNWSKVPYQSFADVDSEGNPIPRGFIPGLDQNVNFFNLDAFLSWDFKLGCNVTVGYKNWIGDTYAIDAAKYQRYLSNFRESLDVPHGNEFTVKAIYFLDYNQLRKKK